MTNNIVRWSAFAFVFLLGPPIMLGIIIAVGLAILWLWHQLPVFQHWGLVIGIACWIAAGAMLVWAVVALRKPD